MFENCPENINIYGEKSGITLVKTGKRIEATMLLPVVTDNQPDQSRTTP